MFRQRSLQLSFSPRPQVVPSSSREEGGSALAFYFAAPSPKFYFRPSEQDLLRLALRHLSDHEAALELGVSLNTIKKRWQDIFRKVEENDPGLFPNKGLISNQRGGKRRHLLAYLAHHLEELRPQKPLR
jgi:DNA-binding NarL/FixJ family response regulator